PCNTPNDQCTWYCGVQGSGIKCSYPTSSPDLVATTKVIWDDTVKAARGSALGAHGYRGGPFVIDAADHDAALKIIDAWNDQAHATRSVGHLVSAHETTHPL